MIRALSRPSRLAMVAALPVLLAAKPLAAPMAGGTTYEFVVRSQSGGKEAVMMRGRGTFAGNDGRIDILETSAQGGGSEMFGGKGSYFLVLDGGKKMLLVNPAEKQYMQWDMASMLAGMSKMVNAVGGLVKMEMSEVKIDAHNMGAGETLQGYPTVHYQLVENYTVSMKMFGRSSKSRSETTTDYYFAPALKNLANPFMANGKAMAQSFDMFNNPDYKEKGKQTVSVVTSEMLNFKNTDIPKSTFAVPSDYKMIEMPKLDANIAAGDGKTDKEGKPVAAPDINADSVANAAKQGAKDAAKDAAKEAAKEGAKSKIKGIFKR